MSQFYDSEEKILLDTGLGESNEFIFSRFGQFLDKKVRPENDIHEIDQKFIYAQHSGAISRIASTTRRATLPSPSLVRTFFRSSTIRW